MRQFVVISACILLVLWLAPAPAFADKQNPDPGKQMLTARWAKASAAIDGNIGPGEYSSAIPCHVELNEGWS